MITDYKKFQTALNEVDDALNAYRRSLTKGIKELILAKVEKSYWVHMEASSRFNDKIRLLKEAEYALSNESGMVMVIFTNNGIPNEITVYFPQDNSMLAKTERNRLLTLVEKIIGKSGTVSTMYAGYVYGPRLTRYSNKYYFHFTIKLK